MENFIEKSIKTKRDSELSKLSGLAEMLSKGKATKIFTGGTSAATVKIDYGKGKEPTVLKLALSDGSGLNNGRRKIIREAKQVNYLRKKYPNFKSLYPEVLNVWEAKHYGAVEFPYYQGNTFANHLRNTKYSQNTVDLTRNIVSNVLNAYLSHYKPSSNNSFYEDKVYKRANFRLKYTDRSHAILTQLMSKEKIIINEEEYINPKHIISMVKSHDKYSKVFKSLFLSDCVHGDLNLRNVFVQQNGHIKLLDLRGSRQKWDMFYDLGKMIFTSGFDRICHFEFMPSVSSGNYILKFASGTHRVNEKWEKIQVLLEEEFATNESFINVIKNEPHWKSKIRLMHAVHYLADCACRVESGSPLNQAFSSFLLGTIYLNRLYRELNSDSGSKEHYSLSNSIRYEK